MKILVVDDEPLIRLGLVSLVEEWGHEPLEAGNAAGALVCLERDSGIALVITDVDMPGAMDGLALARHAATRWPLVRLIVCSGKVALDRAELPAGARFLSKPFRDDLLLSAIEEMQ